MCKKGIAVNVGNESGRLEKIRIANDEESDTKYLVGSFTGRGCASERIVKISQVTPANNKAAKSLKQEVARFNLDTSKNARSGVKSSPAVLVG